jgi:CubicO group peptidase (beta-lactamase class C family)
MSPDHAHPALHPLSELDHAELAQRLEAIRTAGSLPALGAAIMAIDDDGRTEVVVSVAGTRKVRDSTPVAPDDQWHLGSCGKTMTATLVAMLVDEGLLEWKRTLPELLPDLAAKMHHGFAAATLEQLLVHASGVSGDARAAGGGTLWPSLFDPCIDPREGRRLVAETVLSTAPAAPPGTTRAYSNLGYAIVGAALEQATGRRFEDLMRERLFEPLGMASFGFGAPGRGTAHPPDQPWPHDAGADGRPLPLSPDDRYADNPRTVSPAGTVHGSLRDWAKFLTPHLAAAAGVPTSFLRSETLAKLRTPEPQQSYTPGAWSAVTREWARGVALSMTGSNTLNGAIVWLAPSLRRGFLVATNFGSDAALDAADDAIGALIEVIHDTRERPTAAGDP